MDKRLRPNGDWLWLSDESEFAVPVQICGGAGEGAVLAVSEYGKEYKVKSADAAKLPHVHTSTLKGIPNMIQLEDMTEGVILHTLRTRYRRDRIYTYISSIMVSINPFKSLPIYGIREMEAVRDRDQIATIVPSTATLTEGGYEDEEDTNVAARPHPYVLAQNAHRALINTAKNQSVLVSGESGSGKTECTKIILEYLSFISSPFPSSEAGAGGAAGAASGATVRAAMSASALPSSPIHARGHSIARAKGSPFQSPPKRRDHPDDVADAGAAGVATPGNAKVAPLRVDSSEPAKPGGAGGMAGGYGKSLRTTTATGVAKQILEANPLIESFGNARTVRNDNSSRFGKWIEVHFDSQHRITGASISHYLLEKSRVVLQSVGERNYHIFYQLCATVAAPTCAGCAGSHSGAPSTSPRSGLPLLAPVRVDPHALLKPYKLKPAMEFAYLNGGGARGLVIDGVSDIVELHRTIDALANLNFSEADMHCLFATLVAILHLGQVPITPKGKNGEESAMDNANASLVEAASNLGVEPAALEKAICTWVKAFSKRSLIVVPFSVPQALAGRDAMAKHLYSNMFDWVISKVNVTLKTDRYLFGAIGILDIFGFEIFETNRFEQFLINFANEKLQRHFNYCVFELEQEEYKREELDVSYVAFQDNSACVNLIEQTPFGLLSMMDEELRLPQCSDDNLLGRFHKQFAGHACYKAPQFASPVFSVKHYAGLVTYMVEGFTDKNKDRLTDGLVGLMSGSTKSFFKQIFESMAVPAAAAEEKSVTAKPGARARPGGGAGGAGGGGNERTLGTLFRRQLHSLMTKLEATSPHFIKCLKPNAQLVADRFDSNLVLRQLRYAGIEAVIRVRQQGFPVRHAHRDFYARFRVVVPSFSFTIENNDGEDNSNEWAAACKQLVLRMSLPKTDFGMGKTKVFLTHERHLLLERAREAALLYKTIVLQAAWRARRARVRYARMKEAVGALTALIEQGRTQSLQLLLHSDFVQSLKASHEGALAVGVPPKKSLLVLAQDTHATLLYKQVAMKALATVTEGRSEDVAVYDKAIASARALGEDMEMLSEYTACVLKKTQIIELLEERRRAAEAKAEAERRAKEAKADAEKRAAEQAKVDAENAKLETERAKQAKAAEKEKREVERQEAEAKRARERVEREVEAKKEKERLEQEAANQQAQAASRIQELERQIAMVQAQAQEQHEAQLTREKEWDVERERKETERKEELKRREQEELDRKERKAKRTSKRAAQILSSAADKDEKGESPLFEEADADSSDDDGDDESKPVDEHQLLVIQLRKRISALEHENVEIRELYRGQNESLFKKLDYYEKYRARVSTMESEYLERIDALNSKIAVLDQVVRDKSTADEYVSLTQKEAGDPDESPYVSRMRNQEEQAKTNLKDLLSQVEEVVKLKLQVESSTSRMDDAQCKLAAATERIRDLTSEKAVMMNAERQKFSPQLKEKDEIIKQLERKNKALSKEVDKLKGSLEKSTKELKRVKTQSSLKVNIASPSAVSTSTKKRWSIFGGSPTGSASTTVITSPVSFSDLPPQPTPSKRWSLWGGGGKRADGPPPNLTLPAAPAAAVAGRPPSPAIKGSGPPSPAVKPVPGNTLIIPAITTSNPSRPPSPSPSPGGSLKRTAEIKPVSSDSRTSTVSSISSASTASTASEAKPIASVGPVGSDSKSSSTGDVKPTSPTPSSSFPPTSSKPMDKKAAALDNSAKDSGDATPQSPTSTNSDSSTSPKSGKKKDKRKSGKKK